MGKVTTREAPAPQPMRLVDALAQVPAPRECRVCRLPVEVVRDLRDVIAAGERSWVRLSTALRALGHDGIAPFNVRDHFIAGHAPRDA